MLPPDVATPNAMSLRIPEVRNGNLKLPAICSMCKIRTTQLGPGKTPQYTYAEDESQPDIPEYYPRPVTPIQRLLMPPSP